MKRGGPRKGGGFSLLELVVALAIMAMSLGLLYRVSGGAVRTAADTSHYAQAIALAESLLQSHDAIPEGGWRESGSWSSLRWSVTTAPYDSAAGAAIYLYRVQVDISWAEGQRERSFSLVSLRPQRVDVERAEAN